MSTPSTSDANRDPGGPLDRHETEDGSVYWGDISASQFSRATERFPVLRFVIEEYFGSPEKDPRDTEFLARYEQTGEDSAEFSGFLDDLDAAIKQYSLAATLVNGLMGVTLPATEVRRQLTSLKDQVTHQGEFSDTPPEEDQTPDDPWMVSSTQDRLQASFLWERAIPIGPLKDKPFPMYYYIIASVLILLLGLAISYVPFIGNIGIFLMIVGIIGCFLLSVATLGLRNDQMHPEKERLRQEKEREIEERRKERQEKRENNPGLFTRLNPFRN